MSKVNTDAATIVGYWIGLASFVVGILGIFLTIYSFFKDKPDVFILTSSGWGAAVLCASSTGWFGAKLVKLLATQNQESEKQMVAKAEEIADLNFRLAEALSEKNRMIMISEFLATKAVRSATKKQQASKPEAIQGSGNDEIVQ